MNRMIALATVVLTLVVMAFPAFAQSPATPPGAEQKPAQDRQHPGGGPHGGPGGMQPGGGTGGMQGGMMGGQGGMHGGGMMMGRDRMRGGSGSDMCSMMMGGGMGMLDDPGDPKAAARMLKLRGDMLKAMGEVLLKHGAELERSVP